jgi:hypothetical protein
VKLTFESVAIYCNSYANLIPVTFVLGFYVSLVIQRWWAQFLSLPWPGKEENEESLKRACRM